MKIIEVRVIRYVEGGWYVAALTDADTSTCFQLCFVSAQDAERFAQGVREGLKLAESLKDQRTGTVEAHESPIDEDERDFRRFSQ